ncbi:MAG: putative inactive lipase [Acidimicrobiales bacterium]|nr:MAG: alpha/beta fold hydrolase [Actinomycetota bacterium]MBV6508698.1 putative inactive lipase [Acidimicrobiales bacterium]RIK08132.1 MAG: hypothetical protein DCC48_01785 [Acidobacteriota bacterium]
MRYVAAACLLLALVVAGCSDSDDTEATTTSDRRDEFRPEDEQSVPDVEGVEVSYYTPPDALAEGEPGDILSKEPIEIPATTNGQAWKITYVSTVPSGDLVPVTGVIVRPDGEPPEGGFPVVSWAHGTTGVGDQCAPSNTTPFTFLGMEDLVNSGIAVAATDYIGLGTDGQHPYLVGEASGASVIDIVRAAQGPDGVDAANDVVVWGYSQGGQAALFVREMAPDYDPELNILGIVATAPVTDLGTFLQQAATNSEVFPFFAEAIATWSTVYEQVDLSQIVEPEAVEKFRLVNLACTGGVAEAAEGVDVQSLFKEQPEDVEDWAKIVEMNTAIPTEGSVPMLISHGDADTIVPIEGTLTTVQIMCEDGEDVLFLRDPSWDHTGAWLLTVNDVVAWIEARFAGEPAPNNCDEVLAQITTTTSAASSATPQDQ